jgi:hypothetical protein
VKADNLYSQNLVSDIIAAHLKMLTFEKYYPEHEDPRQQNLSIVNPSVEQYFPKKKPFNLLNYHRTND